MSIKHKKTVFAEDGTDPNTVHPSDWNDEHVIEGLLGLFAALAVRPNAFPYVAVDGSGALASISAPALAMLSKATAAAILESIGGVGPASPAFSGAPTAPTAALGTNTDQIATMAALQAMRADLVNSAPSTLDTLNELANALGSDPNFAATVTTALGNRLRVDAAQAFTAAQKAQAIANLALAAVAVSGAYADLTGKPALAPVATSGAYSDLTGRPSLGTAAALNAGTGASQVVQLDGNGRLPAVDGSQLTNIGGSLSYAAAQALTDAQRLQALDNLGAPIACGRLLYSSATALSYPPYKGDLLKVGGQLYRIPVTGVAGLENTGVYVNGVAGQNLAAGTIYYVYAFTNNGVLTGDFCTTSHATSATAGNVGTEIKSGDDTRSLIGMVYTSASGQFQQSALVRGVITWFNRRSYVLATASGNYATSTAYFSEVSTSLRLYFLVWVDEPDVTISAASDLTYTAQCNAGIGVGIDGTTPLPGYGFPLLNNGNHAWASVPTAAAGLSEGVHYATVLGGTNAGTLTYNNAALTLRATG
ncbi:MULTISPECIES: hypothetical protein [unclassified Bradyrhizobium]|uniref:hypothetical protein n=1 Tax=unclassified Bradyrhizobium TaxID=2631580 RepID=UPI002916F3B0|nr:MULTISPECIES: hypothetical protein [unclassified Bradyrhizobium]